MPAVSGPLEEWFPTAPPGTAGRLGCRPMNQIADASELDAVLHRVAGGSLADFATLYDRTASRVYGLVLRVLRDTGYSEETTQEVYLEVWRNAGKYDPAKGSALAWLLAMAHRRAVDRVRAEHAAGLRESRYGAASAEPAADVVVDAVIVGDEQQRVVECLGGLPEKHRECVELTYYTGLTYREVSERLSVTTSTIKTRMQDALRRLRECLGMP